MNTNKHLLPAVRTDGQSIRIMLPDASGITIKVEKFIVRDDRLWVCIIVQSDDHQFSGPSTAETGQANVERLLARLI